MIQIKKCVPGSETEMADTDQSQTEADPSIPAFDPAKLEPYVVKNPEALSLNIARSLENLGKAASEWLQPRERGEKKNAEIEPLTDLVATISKVVEYWVADPARTLEAQTHLMTSYFGIWMNSMSKAAGKPLVAPEVRSDK